MTIMTCLKFHFNWLMLTLIFGIQAFGTPRRVWRTTKKAGPYRVGSFRKAQTPFQITSMMLKICFEIFCEQYFNFVEIYGTAVRICKPIEQSEKTFR